MPKSLKRNYKKSQRRNYKKNTFKKSLKRKSLKRTSLKRKSYRRKNMKRKSLKKKSLKGGGKPMPTVRKNYLAAEAAKAARAARATDVFDETVEAGALRGERPAVVRHEAVDAGYEEEDDDVWPRVSASADTRTKSTVPLIPWRRGATPSIRKPKKYHTREFLRDPALREEIKRQVPGLRDFTLASDEL